MAYQGRSQSLPAKSKAQRHNTTNQKRPHASKNRKSRIPPPQAARIMQRYVAGENIRSIAGTKAGTVAPSRESSAQRKCRPTPSKCARNTTASPNWPWMVSVARWNKATMASWPMKFLRNLGVIPTAEDISLQRVQQPRPVTEADRVKFEMLKLLTSACERAEMYGHPEPCLEDFKAPLRLTGRSDDRKSHELE